MKITHGLVGAAVLVGFAVLTQAAYADEVRSGIEAANAQFSAIAAKGDGAGLAALYAADGQVLPLRKWLPDGAVKAVILALHGFNDYSNAFEGPGEVWAHRGIATYAYDQRGFGGAPGRGLWPGRAALAARLAVSCRAGRFFWVACSASSRARNSRCPKFWTPDVWLPCFFCASTIIKSTPHREQG